MNAATMRKLAGRRIVRVEPRAFLVGRGRACSYQPVFVLDDGAEIAFTVDETESGDTYGVTPYFKQKAKAKAKP